MSKATKRKHVVREVLEDFVLPQPHQQIVKVLAGRGNNLHQIEAASGDTFLVSMPTKFRKNIWIKRGDYVVVQPIAEGDKVKAEIISILYKEQIKYIKQEGHWPTEFGEKVDKSAEGMIPDDMLPDSEGEDDDVVVRNPNRIQAEYVESESDDSDEESEEETELAGQRDDSDGDLQKELSKNSEVPEVQESFKESVSTTPSINPSDQR